MAAPVRRPPAPRLDEGAKSYYKRVESFLDVGGEEEDVFLRNVVDQVISDGVRLVSCDKDGSRALELLLQHFSMDSESTKKLMSSVESDFFKLCVNRCGSHVIQALLRVAANHTSSGDDELLTLFLSLVSTVEEKVAEYIRHPYASHVLGGVIQNLGGVYLSERVGRSRYSQEFRKVKMVGAVTKKASTQVETTPESFVSHLEKIARRVGKMNNLKELLTHQNGSPVLQCLLKVLSHRAPQRTEKLIKKLLKLSKVLGGEGDLPDMFTDLVGSHLMETMIQVATPDLHQLIFSTCFKGHVMMAALHAVANFPLQHLIAKADPTLVSQVLSQYTVEPLKDCTTVQCSANLLKRELCCVP